MKRLAVVAATALAATLAASTSILAAPQRVALTPTKSQQLATYLAAVKPLAAKVLIAQAREAGGAILISVRGEPGDFVLFRAQCRALGLASVALRKVARPAFIAEPHAALVAGWRAEAIACARYATAIEAQSDTADSDYDVYLGSARKDQKHWRTEVVVQLRRVGLVVPAWALKVGADPLG